MFQPPPAPLEPSLIGSALNGVCAAVNKLIQQLIIKPDLIAGNHHSFMVAVTENCRHFNNQVRNVGETGSKLLMHHEIKEDQ